MIYTKVDWLDGESSPTATSSEAVAGASMYCIEVHTTGSPTNVQVDLQGSLDGSTWATLAQVQLSGPPSGIAWVTGKPVRYVRVSLEALSGGSSPTASASVSAFS